MKKVKLVSTLSGEEYPLERIEEFADNGESLEVKLDFSLKPKIREGKYIFQRFADYLPFDEMEPEYSLGEGNTPLTESAALSKYTGIENLYLKNETMNPTSSFKDRGSLTTVFYVKGINEQYIATISTGNMGHSVSAYGAKARLKVIVFVPQEATLEKLSAISIHGTQIIILNAPDYSTMKHAIMDYAKEKRLRIISGNHAMRVEGYKLTAFELYEQMDGDVPDFIAVPTSACGHIRGLFKGYKELKETGNIEKIPRMIVVQAKNNSPIVEAIKQKRDEIIPYKNIKTIAGAISMGIPLGGNEIVRKAHQYGWLAENVTEEEIMESQKQFAKSGYLVEPSSATVLDAVRKLRTEEKIKINDKVVLILTGSGLKDMKILKNHPGEKINLDVKTIKRDLPTILKIG